MLVGLSLIFSVARGSTSQDDHTFAELFKFEEQLEDENSGAAFIDGLARGSTSLDDDTFAELFKFAEQLEDENSGAVFFDGLASADAAVPWEDYWELVTNSQGAAQMPVDCGELDMDGDEVLSAFMTDLSELKPDGFPEQISSHAMRGIKIENSPAIVSPDSGSITEALFVFPSGSDLQVKDEPVAKKPRARGTGEVESLAFAAPAAGDHVMTPMSGASFVEASVDLSDPMGNNWATEKLFILNYMFENLNTLPKASSVYENLKTRVPSTTISLDYVSGLVRELASQICVPKWLHKAVMKHQSVTRDFVTLRPKNDKYYLSSAQIAEAALTWCQFCTGPSKANPESEPLWFSQTDSDGKEVMCMKAEPRSQFLYKKLLELE